MAIKRTLTLINVTRSLRW